MSRITIIGGGFSGLAAAVKLAEAGAQVTLLERRAYLGGRAYSFLDAKTGAVVDNGQHLFMSCYTETVAFLNKIGRQGLLRFQNPPKVEFIDRGGRVSEFTCAALPAPLHALFGIFRMKGLSVADKLRVMKVGRAIKRRPNATDVATVSDWLSKLGQSEKVKDRFWYPMAIATLNESPTVASARMMRVVLERAFGGGYRDCSLGLSRVGLSDLYTGGAQQFIEERGGSVRTGAAVEQLLFDGSAIRGCRLAGGEEIASDVTISAVTPSALSSMLPDAVRAGHFQSLAELKSSPIVSINLWFDRPIVNTEFAAMLGTNVQWLFNRDAICKPGKQPNHLALVISAAHDYVDRGKEDLVGMALKELADVVPGAENARLVHSRIVKERDATISQTVNSDLIRPGPKTAIRNLILAGDWTATGLPATIESAVVSGNRAADAALEELSAPRAAA